MDPTKIILALEIELLQVNVRHSVSRLGELLADDFFEIGSSGKRYNKQDILNILPNQPEDKYNITDFHIYFVADNTILATYQVVRDVVGTNKVKYSLHSSIWQFRNTKWQIIFHQGTPQILEPDFI